MSESSSILAKAIKIYNAEFQNQNLYYKSQLRKPLKLNYQDHNTDEEIKQDPDIQGDYNNLIHLHPIGGVHESIHKRKTMDALRFGMSRINTKYLTYLLDNDIDFVALIEQVVHAGKNNHANYDEFLNIPLDLTNENHDYGLLNRLGEMSHLVEDVDELVEDVDELVEDVDEPLRINRSKKYKYACVYDTIVNCQGQNLAISPTRSSVAEGISIIYRKKIFGNNPVMATWDKKSNASVQKLKTLNPDAFERMVDRDVHYYSDDSGMSLCYPNGIPAKTEDNETKPLEFVTQRGKADGGRPIIMTAGVNTDTNSLIILVAVHGPNIPNLYKNGDDLKDEQNQLKNRFDEEIDRLFDKVRTSISKFINDGIKAIKPASNVKDQNIKKVEVYFGGDLNDARGLILKRLLRKPAEQNESASDNFGLELSFDYGESKHFKQNVTFSGYSSLETDENINNVKDSKNENTQGRYKSLYSCCANGDSLTGDKRYDRTINKLNKQGNGTFDMVHLYKFSKFSTNMTNLDFIDPANFGYNGDYALYGTTDPTFNETMHIMLDLSELLKYYNVYSSDHLPVISSLTNPPFQAKGGRRRRYSRRAPIRRTRKGVPKKLRASRRKRRARTYKKI